MSYKRFSTDNADYYLVNGMHFSGKDEAILKQPLINSLDAIILESSGKSDILHILEEYRSIRKNLKHAEKNIPAYLVDVGNNLGGYLTSFSLAILLVAAGSFSCKAGIKDLKKKKSRRDFLKGGLKTLLGASVWGTYIGQTLNAAQSGEAVPILPELTTTLGYLPPTPMIELRNAITARKVEEFVVPKLRKEKNKRPLVALVYAGFHAGIETDLKYKYVRDTVLGFYETIGYLGIKKEGLNIVWEIDLKRGSKVKHPVDLF